MMAGSSSQLQQYQQPIFHDLKFYLQESYVTNHPNQAESVSKVINKHGGKRVLSPHDDVIYVFDTFNSEEYFKNKEYGKPIIGVKYLLECAEKNQTIDYDRLSKSPIYSSCLSGVYISLFGFSIEVNQKIVSLVSDLCGEYIPKITSQVNIVIINPEIDSDSFSPSMLKSIELLRKYQIPLVSPEWIKQCYENVKLIDYKNFSAVFYSCTICSSGLQNHEKIELKHLISDRFGSFVGNFDGNVNILVSNTLNSDKCSVATKNGIPIVSIDWIRESANTGIFQSFKFYSLENQKQPQQQYQQQPQQYQQHQFKQPPQKQQLVINQKQLSFYPPHQQKAQQNYQQNTPYQYSSSSSSSYQQTPYYPQQQQFPTPPNQRQPQISQSPQQSYRSGSGTLSFTNSNDPLTKFEPTPFPSSLKYGQSTYESQPLQPQQQQFLKQQNYHYQQKMQPPQKYHQQQQQQEQYYNGDEEMVLYDDGTLNESILIEGSNLFHGKNILIKGYYGKQLFGITKHIQRFAQVIDEESIPSDWTSTTLDVHFIIAPHESNIILNPGTENIPIVTIDWFDKCLNLHQIFDPIECPTFQPLPNLNIFFNVSCTTDGFTEIETSNIRNTVKLARGQFTTKITRNTTHFICPSPQGIKYKKALALKIQVVSIEWLYRSARAGCLLDESEFTFNKLLGNGNDTNYNHNNTSMTIFNDLIIFISNNIISSTDKYIKCIKGLGGKHSSSGFDRITHYITWEYDSIEAQGFVNQNFIQVTPKWLEECWSQRSKLDESLFQPKIENNSNNPDTNKNNDSSLPIYESVTKTPSQLFSRSQDKLTITTTATTTSTTSMFEKEQVKDQQNKIETLTNEEHIIESTSKETDEIFLGDGMEMTTTTTTTTIKTDNKATTSGGFDKIFKALSALPVNSKPIHTKIGINKNRIEIQSNQNKLQLAPRINKPQLSISSIIDSEKLLERDDDDSDQEPMKIDDDNNSSVSNTSSGNFNNMGINNNSMINDQYQSDEDEDSTNYFTQSSIDTSSQMITYGYDAEVTKKQKILESNYLPSGIIPGSKTNSTSSLSSTLVKVNNSSNNSTALSILNMLNRPTQQSSDQNNNSSINNNNNNNNNDISGGNGSGVNKKPGQKTPVVVFSGIADDVELEGYQADVIKFGCHLENNISKDVTHVITKQPSRSEKVMGGSAAGAWVLKPQYLIDSREKGKLLDEKLYQWNQHFDDEKIDLWVKTSYLCRKLITLNNGRQLFEGARVGCFPSPPGSSTDSWKRVLSCGNAELIDLDSSIKDLKSLSKLKLTHVLVINNAKRPKDSEIIFNIIESNDIKTIKKLTSADISSHLNNAEYLVPKKTDKALSK